jgi:glycerol-3-phosphate acyltransferase PlsX
MLRMIGEQLGPKDPGTAKQLIGSVAQRVDYAQYGGAPLLGLMGCYLIGHGRSGPEAYKHAVRVTREYVHGKVGERIVESLMPVAKEEA